MNDPHYLFICRLTILRLSFISPTASVLWSGLKEAPPSHRRLHTACFPQSVRVGACLLSSFVSHSLVEDQRGTDRNVRSGECWSLSRQGKTRISLLNIWFTDEGLMGWGIPIPDGTSGEFQSVFWSSSTTLYVGLATSTWVKVARFWSHYALSLTLSSESDEDLSIEINQTNTRL